MPYITEVRDYQGRILYQRADADRSDVAVSTYEASYDELIEAGAKCPDSHGWGEMRSSQRRPAILRAYNELVGRVHHRTHVGQARENGD